MSDKHYYQVQKNGNDKIKYEPKPAANNQENSVKPEETKASVNKSQHYYRDQNRWPRRERFEKKNTSVETVDDIKADIKRIEKEIDLEIKDIKSLRL